MCGVTLNSSHFSSSGLVLSLGRIHHSPQFFVHGCSVKKTKLETDMKLLRIILICLKGERSSRAHFLWVGVALVLVGSSCDRAALVVLACVREVMHVRAVLVCV